jgi:hypothetical protein
VKLSEAAAQFRLNRINWLEALHRGSRFVCFRLIRPGKSADRSADKIGAFSKGVRLGIWGIWQTRLQFQAPANDGSEHIGRDGDPDLSLSLRDRDCKKVAGAIIQF